MYDTFRCRIVSSIVHEVTYLKSLMLQPEGILKLKQVIDSYIFIV